MKIGLMGGTFNPIHCAHLRIAEEARDLCRLDRVLFIPAADPPINEGVSTHSITGAPAAGTPQT